jgi:hypothetical protein
MTNDVTRQSTDGCDKQPFIGGYFRRRVTDLLISKIKIKIHQRRVIESARTDCWSMNFQSHDDIDRVLFIAG